MRLAATLLVAFGLTAGIAAADDHRYYDREHRDYHKWDDGEAKRWQEYRNERHIREERFERLRAAQRRDYWKWRHEHEEHR